MKIQTRENAQGDLEGIISFDLVSGGKKQLYLQRGAFMKNHPTTNEDKLALLDLLMGELLSRMMRELRRQVESGVPSRAVVDGAVVEKIAIKEDWRIE